VDDPFRPGEYVTSVFMERGGIATSGRDYRHWIRAGRPQHHIIDPHTGEPAETDVLTATVIAPDAMQAEAMAKAVLIAGSQAGLAWLDEGDQYAGLLILDDGRRLHSRNLARYL
jgi:thiamine biosynthesis lipoprotein